MASMVEHLPAPEMNEWFAHFKLRAEERKEAQKKAKQQAEAHSRARRY